jgi:predicted small lipoprotein YifL
MKTWVLVVCGSVILTGCGQKGPLYLPDKNASVVTRPAGSTNTSTTPPAAPGTAAPSTTAPDQPPPPQTPPATTPPKQDKNGDDSQSSNSTPKS